MIITFVTQLLFKVVCLILGILAVRATMLWMDKYLVPEEFKEWINGTDNLSKALYYGLRVIGVCLMVGFALS